MNEQRTYHEYNSYGKDALISFLEELQRLIYNYLERMKEKRLRTPCDGIFGFTTYSKIGDVLFCYAVYCPLRGKKLDAECDKFGIKRNENEKDYQLAHRLMARITGNEKRNNE